MKYKNFSTHTKKGIQISLILAILLFNFTVSGTRTVHAAPPLNDDIDQATEIDQLTYQNIVDLTDATQDPSDPDDVACGTSGTTELNTLNRGNNTVWYTYTPTVRELIAVNTIGSEYTPGDDMDTYVAVWKGAPGSLTFVKCNDDNFVGQTSELTFRAQAGVDYYIEVANYNCESGISSCGQQTGGTLVFNATISNTHVTIAGQLKDSYYISTGQSVKDTYGKLNTGPVLLETGLDQPFVAAMSVNYKQAGKFVSYSQTMGFPADQVTTEYVFPRYTSNSSQNSQLRIANVDDADTTVQVYIGGIPKGTPIPLAAGEATTVSYSGTDAGPVRVVSTELTVNIIASMRVIYKYNGQNVSYSELMGYPGDPDKLTTAYLFPWYVNNTNLKSQLRVANMGTETTNIKVYINGVLKKTHNGLAAGNSIPLSVRGNGTMRVVSTNSSVDILASLRQIYRQNSVPVSYSELMGFPEDQLTKQYAFPWYTNNSSMSTKVRIVNMGAEDATVEVYIGQNLEGSHLLPAGEGKSFSYSGVNGGPVRVDSKNPNVNILVSLQITYKPYGIPVSYSELTGYPYLLAQPTISYLFPWYTNKKSIKSNLLFGYP